MIGQNRGVMDTDRNKGRSASGMWVVLALVIFAGLVAIGRAIIHRPIATQPTSYQVR
jgi:hypothetical protein